MRSSCLAFFLMFWSLLKSNFANPTFWKSLIISRKMAIFSKKQQNRAKIWTFSKMFLQIFATFRTNIKLGFSVGKILEILDFLKTICSDIRNISNIYEKFVFSCSPYFRENVCNKTINVFFCNVFDFLKFFL